MTGRFLVKKEADLVITSGRRPLFKTWKDNMLNDKMSWTPCQPLKGVSVSTVTGLFSTLLFLPEASGHTSNTITAHSHKLWAWHRQKHHQPQTNTITEHGLLMPHSRHSYHNLLQIKKEKNLKALYLKVKSPSELNRVYIWNYGYKPTIFTAMSFGI